MYLLFPDKLFNTIFLNYLFWLFCFIFIFFMLFLFKILKKSSAIINTITNVTTAFHDARLYFLSLLFYLFLFVRKTLLCCCHLKLYMILYLTISRMFNLAFFDFFSSNKNRTWTIFKLQIMAAIVVSVLLIVKKKRNCYKFTVY